MADGTMIVLDSGGWRFQFRAAAFVRHNEHILVHRSTADPFWALPGGRVEFHESAAETLSREITEEMGSDSIIGPLRLIVENFFELNGRRYHEIGFYFDAELDAPPPFMEGEIVHRVHESDYELEFRWALPRELPELDLKPTTLHGLLAKMPRDVVHVVHRDVVP